MRNRLRDALEPKHPLPAIRGIVVVAVLLPVILGCGKPNPSDLPKRLDQVTDFAELFGRRCAGCHGADGELGSAPPLNDPLFLAIIPSDAFRRVVTKGRKNTLMPARGGTNWDAMTPHQIDIVIDSIRHRWGGPPSLAGVAPPYLIPYTQEGKLPGDPQNGRSLFGHICARCHGKNGQGADSGPIHSPALLGLISDQLLRRIIITGRPDLDMPDYRRLGDLGPDHKPLTSQQVSDLVAYVLTWREPALDLSTDNALTNKP